MSTLLPESDNLIYTLINQIKGLFGNKQNNATHIPVPISQTGNINLIPSAGEYRAPLHGTWHSSGGFNLGARRPNGSVGHQGVDMRAPAGTPIYPLMPGIVTNVGTDPHGGNVVNIEHPNGIRTYYAHLSAARVQKGDKVDNNTIIGTVGTSGNAKGTFPHLHFQVWKDGQITDPAKFFAVPKYTDLSAEEKHKGPWLSQQAKQEAAAFNMKEHISNNRIAFSKDIDKLYKIANTYCKISLEIK